MPLTFATLTEGSPESAALAVTEGRHHFSVNGTYGADQTTSAAALSAGTPARLTGVKPGVVLEWTHETSPSGSTEWKPIATIPDPGDPGFTVDLEAGSCRARLAGPGDSSTSLDARLDS